MPDPTEAARVVPIGDRHGRVWRELRRHRTAYAVLFAFMLAGPAIVHLIFPEASIWVGVVGGLALGVWGAACAVPDKFLG